MTQSIDSIRETFAAMLRQPEPTIDLVAAALTIARTAYPDLDADGCVDQLNTWADLMRRRLGTAPSAGEIIEAVNQLLFQEEGFDGDRDNYFDPQNSFLNRVLARRRGIPISLSLVYCEVGRRAGFELAGISLPGHFIVGLFDTAGTLFIDPFNRGEILAESECRRLVTDRYGVDAVLDPQWARPADKRAVLIRMLRNLKAIYRGQNRQEPHFEMIQWILSADADAPIELKERGLMYADMGNSILALRDLERWLEVVPDAPNRETIADLVHQLKDSRQRLH